MKITKSRLLALFVILLLAAGLRLWQIDTLPPGFHLDESYEGMEAWKILTDPTYRPIFLEGGFGVPPVNAYANAITFGLFQHFGGEVGPVAMRTTAAMVGLLGVLALYLLAEEMRRHEEALPPLFPLFAAASMAVLRWHIHFSRMGIEPIFVPLLWTVGAWLLLRSWRTGNLLTFVATGVALAATLYTYQAAWIIPFLALLILASLVWKEPSILRKRGIGLLLCGAVAFGLVAPLLVLFWQRPELMLLRPQQISVIADAERPDLWANLWTSVRMFALWGASGDPELRRNLPGVPVLNLWLTIPFYVGMLVALWRVKRPVYAMLLFGMVGLALPGIVTDQVPHFHRILGVSAPTALLVGLGASMPLAIAAHSTWTKRLRYAAVGAGVVLLAVGGGLSVYDYFGVWAKSPALYYAFDGGLWDAGRWMMKMPADTPIFFTPRTITHPTLEFSLLTAPKPRLTTFDGRSVFPAAAGPIQVAEQYVVLEQEDFRTRLLLPHVFPDAILTQEWKDWSGDLSVRVYTRPAGSLPKRHPKHARPASLGDGIRLLGYDSLPVDPHPGDMLYIQLHWAVDQPPTQEWTVFVHLLSAADTAPTVLVAGKDGPPGNGSLPSVRWRQGWLILDEYQVALPPELPAGTYALEIGLYQADGKRLPATGSIRLGDISVGN